jgi:hypothetical protein
MNIHRPKEQLAALVVFLLPLALVKGGPVLIGGGPAAVHASPGRRVEPPAIPVDPEPRTWSDEQRAAAAHVRFLRTQPFGSSPLFHVAAPPPPKQPDNDTPVTGTEIPPPDVVVQAILTRRSGNHVALIDRKRYQVGDAIGKAGWIVTKIDGPNRSVTIEHPPSEQTATLVVPMPSW